MRHGRSTHSSIRSQFNRRQILANRNRSLALALAITLLLIVVVAGPLTAQTFTAPNLTPIYTFTGGSDGGTPYSGLTILGTSLYGTTRNDGSHGVGTVYKLKLSGSQYILSRLYEFGDSGDNDGENPESGVAFGRDGSLYGTTVYGGSMAGGTAYKLTLSATVCKTALCYWNESVLHSFGGGTDGYYPGLGRLAFDQAGNVYGTTYSGGTMGCGTIFELTDSGGTWTEMDIYNFLCSPDGYEPDHHPIFDNAGNLYGTTKLGGPTNGSGGCGVVYQLAPSRNENILLNISSLGNGACNAIAGLIIDQLGNLYGTTASGGSAGGGIVFELSPSGGGWTVNELYNLSGTNLCGPWGNLAMDNAGNLYGTTFCDGVHGGGSVFELTPSGGGQWTYNELWDFTGGSDGKYPIGDLTFDSTGNLYGTASAGGNGSGVVWKVANP